MFVKLDNFGRLGVITDTLNSALPIGSWTDARNMRFTGRQMEKMLEPVLAYPFSSGTPKWMQGWADGVSTYVVIATQQDLFFLQAGSESDPGTWLNVTRAAGQYDASGVWDSFAWGDTCIFNNGLDAPQIFDRSILQFIDLPNWGLISSADDISNFSPPSLDTGARAKILKPYKNQLVAFGVTENGEYQPNTVWWSDVTSWSTVSTDGPEGSGPPLWDYESPETASGKSEVGIGYGAITCAVQLNENMVIYTDNSATLMQFVGGGFIMSFRRLFGKGAAGQKCVAEFNNQHFVVSRDQIYLHDGSSVQLIAKDRVEEEFFRRIGKSGRYGGVSDIDWETVQVVQNPDRKEISVVFDRVGTLYLPDFVCGDPVLALANLEAVTKSADLWQHYHDGKGMIQGSSTGQKLMFINSGDSTDGYLRSLDGGSSWTQTDNLTNGGSYPGILTSIGYDEVSGTWYALNFQDGNENSRLFRTEDDGTDWVYIFNMGTYGHGILVDGADDQIYCGAYGGLDPAKIRRFPGLPLDNRVEKILSSPTVTGGECSQWATYDFGDGNILMLWAAQGSAEIDGMIIAKNFTSGTSHRSLQAKFDDVHRVGNSNLENVVLIAGDNPSVNVVKFFIVTSDTASIEGGPALPTFTIDFGTPVVNPCIAWSPVNNGWLCVAQDVQLKNVIHLRYNSGTNYTDWTAIESLTLSGYVSTDANRLDRQLYYSNDNIFYYAYIGQYNSEEFATLDRILFGIAPVAPNVGKVFHSHFDVKPSGAFTSVTGGDTTTSLAVGSPKYGVGSMASTGAAFGTVSGDVEILLADHTIEMYYDASSMGAVAGLFTFGVLDSSTFRLMGYVNAAGDINYLCDVEGVRLFTVTTATGVVTAAQGYIEICFECDKTTNNARIYVNGVLVATSPYLYQSKWDTQKNLYIGYAYTGSTRRYSQGPIDEMRITNSSLYKGVNYTPHTEAFPD